MNLIFNIKKAFSLAEMMVVMLILSIVLAAATPIITKRVVANEKAEQLSSIPTGSIMIWSGTSSSIPEGWHLCDGTNGTPDLRSRFIVGAGSDSGSGHSAGSNGIGSGYYRPKDLGGEDKHTLTIAEMPQHRHTIGMGPSGAPGAVVYVLDRYGSWLDSDTGYTGGNQVHENRPPYFALYYIMKL